MIDNYYCPEECLSQCKATNKSIRGEDLTFKCTQDYEFKLKLSEIDEGNLDGFFTVTSTKHPACLSSNFSFKAIKNH